MWFGPFFFSMIWFWYIFEKKNLIIIWLYFVNILALLFGILITFFPNFEIYFWHFDDIFCPNFLTFQHRKTTKNFLKTTEKEEKGSWSIFPHCLVNFVYTCQSFLAAKTFSFLFIELKFKNFLFFQNFYCSGKHQGQNGNFKTAYQSFVFQLIRSFSNFFFQKGHCWVAVNVAFDIRSAFDFFLSFLRKE